jgi:hypothetical protein
VLRADPERAGDARPRAHAAVLRALAQSYRSPQRRGSRATSPHLRQRGGA